MTGMQELKERLERAFTDIQRLDIQPTEANMVTLLGIMQAMREAYRYIEEHPEPVEMPEEPVEK